MSGERTATIPDGVVVRSETPADAAAIFAVNAAAFETDAEARLVEALREGAEPFVSLVAEEAGAVVGHVAFSPATLPGEPGDVAMGLAPVAVVPGRQRRGIGSALVRAGLARCAELGRGAVIVLGHPGYYPRFGFRPASRFGLRCEYDAPDEAFMALELAPGALAGRAGVARYHPVFGDL